MSNKQKEYDEAYRTKNRHIRSMYKKIVQLFASGIFPKKSKEKFERKLTLEELEVFNKSFNREEYYIKRIKKGKKL